MPAPKLIAKKAPAPQGQRQTTPARKTSRSAEWDWDDSADEAIDQLGKATIQVEQDELASTAGSNSILSEFDAIRKGVNNHSDFPDVTTLNQP